MRKIIKYNNCVITVNNLRASGFQNHLHAATKIFMEKISKERKMAYGNGNTSENFSKK